MKKPGETIVFLPKAEFTEKQLELIGPAKFYSEKVNNDDDLIEKCKNAEAVLAANSRTGALSAKFFDSLPNLKFVSVYSTAFDWVDLEAAKRNNVTVSYCPGFATEAVANWTISMITKLIQPKGKTLGVIRLGRSGLEVAEKAAELGMKVIAWDRKQKASNQVPLHALLRQSDVVSLHLALNEETRNFIGVKELAAMKPGAVLIDSAREGLFDLKALEKALESGKLSGAAIDLDHHSKTLLAKAMTTNHVAGNSAESYALGNVMFVQNLVKWREGKEQNRLV